MQIYVNLLEAARLLAAIWASALGTIQVDASIFIASTSSVTLTDEFSCHCQERLFYILWRFCTCLYEWNSEFVGKFFGLRFGNDLVRCSVGFVSHQQLDCSLRSISVDFFQPIIDVIKGFRTRHIKNHNDPIGSPIISRSDCAESLLSGRIPNLKFHRFVFDFHGTESKVDPNCRNVWFCKCVILLKWWNDGKTC